VEQRSAVSRQRSAIQSIVNIAASPSTLLTALFRLGMCDLFIHGTAAPNYDRAMEL